ncbi:MULTISPECIES: AMP-binding protein [Legionella]|uniref:AMP-binding protein n=1 Tax=Legionella TaxID=445 RepID=UPI00095C8199|nr:MULTISPECIES: AMP-binding protein [Legionella]MBN9229118.1 AMP-binding protein [Legionella steelei]OJW17028.1 MAG: hypothetical protein BGO44_13835 [Legionella sp. 39-23]
MTPSWYPFQTIFDKLIQNKNQNPQKVAYRFINKDRESGYITYEELCRQVFHLVHQIQQRTNPQDRVILCTQPGLDFIVGFYACIATGTVAVPLFPPLTNMMANRFLHIINNVDAQLILFDKRTSRALHIDQKINQFVPHLLKPFLNLPNIPEHLFNKLEHMRHNTLFIDSAHKINPPSETVHSCTEHDVAFIQYTSGSTADPKGVLVTHENLIDNSNIIQKMCQNSEESISYSWLPPYHDMGLIAGIIQPIYAGATAIILPTLDFIERPARWVEGVSKYRCTVTGGPNFAYELCALKTPKDSLQQLDLSCLHVAANGAEPIHYKTMELFYSAFTKAGLKKNVFLPCYGLAESTLMVSGKTCLTEDKTLSVNSKKLKHHVVELCDTEKNKTVLVSSGKPQMPLKIVNPNDLSECTASEIGEICIQSRSVAKGYFNNLDETEKTFRARIKNNTAEGVYLRTGDLGFLHEGELYVCGRIKNMIIVRGQNYYPHDIELAVTHADPALRKGCVVAYASQLNHEEGIVVVAELKAQTPKHYYSELANKINQMLAQEIHLSAQQIILLPPKSIPKTTSGKLQRIKCKELIEEHKIIPLFSYCAPEELYENNRPNQLLPLLQAAPVDKRSELLQNYLQQLIKEVAHLPQESVIDPERRFMEMGMDSLMFIEFKNTLQELLDNTVALTNDVFFENDHLISLSNYLLEQLHLENTLEELLIPKNVHQDIHFKGGEHAILLLYGLSGTPLELMYLARHLHQQGYSIEIPHIDGYAFLKDKNTNLPHEEWIESVARYFQDMKQKYKTVSVGGLCAGSILSLKLAALFPSQVESLIILSPSFFYDGWAVPWYSFLSPLIYHTPLKYYLYYKEKAPYGIKNAETRRIIEDEMQENRYSITGGSKISYYRINEAKRLNKNVKQNLASISCPVLMIHAVEDETASLRNVNFIENKIKSKTKRKVILTNSYHIVTADNDKDIVVNETINFLKQNVS